MKFNKILSAALVVVMLFASFACLIPLRVEAAHSEHSMGSANLSAAEIKEIVVASYSYAFNSAQEMLDYELERGYIDYVSAPGGAYTIYVNRYTGLVYYKNNVSGQILTSNPYNLGTSAIDTRKSLMNQIVIQYSKDNGTAGGVLTGAVDAGERGQISTAFIPGGIRVNYTIGDTTTRFIVPMQITYENFVKNILDPMLAYYENLFEKELIDDLGLEITENYKFYEQEKWSKDPVYDDNGRVSLSATFRYATETAKIYDKLLDKNNKDSDLYDILNNANLAIKNLVSDFRLNSPEDADEKLIEQVPLLSEGRAVYTCSQGDDNSKLRRLQSRLAMYAGYNVDMLTEDEGECGYEHKMIEHPVFRCSLEYTFNEDMTLSVRLPVNSIVFDESTYNLDYISPLQFFGAGNLKEDGYVFIPDGSGSVIDYEDFYSSTTDDKKNVYLKLSVYGDDFAYANPSGKHKELISLPVYGLTSCEGNSPYGNRSEKIDSGYFAILEEGASLATLYVSYGGVAHNYSSVYVSYSPYPSDKYVSNSTTGGSASEYTIVSDSKYTGSYVTRYVMLGDDETVYDPSYVGMATYYRDYLKGKGVLKALTNLGDDIPLYIEALGSMTVVEKFLTFPVTVSKALTTFDDVITMYKELSDVTSKFEAKAQEYREKSAAEADNKTLHDKYLARAEEYDDLVASMDSIKNINFKLTGFANGGMYFTYPTKVVWEDACGGAAGFNKLVNTAGELTVGESNFGVYPEFDFTYKSNSAWFDGINDGTDISRMVDNRYASKQVYNSVLAIYESFYSMVISTDALDRLYTSFNNSYSEFGHKFISVGTLGSDLNSNFDKENPINRDESASNVMALLDRISSVDKYEIMTSVGNSYVLEYADHILDVATDSSHLAYSSYTVPFIGMVLHSYVSYAGSPLNYSGSPDYEILRAIENGAAPYYILCYDNTEFMKEDAILNDYYGIDYQNWYDNLVQQYNKLNKAIGKYQGYEIVDHKIVIAERVIDDNEAAANRELLKNEFLELVEKTIVDEVNSSFDSMYGNPELIGKGINLDVKVEKLVKQASEVLNIEFEELNSKTDNATDETFREKLDILVSGYLAEYGKADGTLVSIDSVDYVTKYDFVTDSIATDDDYDYTDYTADNKRVAVVTYRNAETGNVVRFILNYNVYSVTVKLDADTTVKLPKYGFEPIE